MLAFAQLGISIALGAVEVPSAALYCTLASALSNDAKTAASAATPTHNRTGVAGFCAITFREHAAQTHLEVLARAHRSTAVAVMEGELRARAHTDDTQHDAAKNVGRKRCAKPGPKRLDAK